MKNVEIGERIYLIYENELYEEEVYMVGEEEFIVQSAFDSRLLENYRKPLRYDDIDKTWTKSLPKNAIRFDEKAWELEEDENRRIN